MMRSLYSAVSGLKNHQIKMDVIGNNIANVNTTGFKKETTNFKEMLNQTVQGATSPTTDQNGNPLQGGTSPIQIGLGVTLGSVSTVMTQGNTQSTGKNTDLMIQGDGFFVLKNAGKEVYSRAGSFDPDGEGFLSDLASGARVQGYMFDAQQTPIDPTAALDNIQLVKGTAFPGTKQGDPDYVGLLDSFSIDNSGTITGIYTDPATNSSVVRKIAQIGIAIFANPQGLSKEGGNVYSTSNNSGDPKFGVPGDGGRGNIMTGSLEMSNVDLSQEFTDMIITQRGFQANTRVVTVSDSLLEELINLKRS